MAYLLDASVFIEAKRRHYVLDYVLDFTPFEMLRLERARFVLGRGDPPR